MHTDQSIHGIPKHYHCIDKNGSLSTLVLPGLDISSSKALWQTSAITNSVT